MKRYLGIDYGTKRIGLALGDDLVRVASPFKVAADLAEVVGAAKDEGIDALVVGLPKTMRGQAGKMHQAVEVFIGQLAELTGLPVETVDERLSSKAGDALEGDRKDKAPRDAVAAMIILQHYLDKL